MAVGAGSFTTNIDRRTILLGLLAVGVAIPASALLSGCSEAIPPSTSGLLLLEGWNAPQELVSQNGVLSVQQIAATTTWDIGGVSYPAKTLTGTIPSATWRVRPGDEIRVRMTNQLGDQITNLHVHGFHVTPEGNSDNVYVEIEDGTSFDYKYDLPEDHPPGSYWYHPHRHHNANEQISGGMAGMIIIDGLEDKVPVLKGIPQAVVVLQGVWTDPTNTEIYTHFLDQETPDNLTEQMLCNGVVNPTMTLDSGAPVWLRVVNASATGLARVQLSDHALNIIAVDGNPLTETEQVSSWDLPPGGRIDAIVIAGEVGSYTFGTLEATDLYTTEESLIGYNQRIDDSVFNKNTAYTFEVVSAGSSTAALTIPTTLTSEYFEDLSSMTPDRTRKITVGIATRDDDTLAMQMDGKEYQTDRIDQQPQLGTMEEWRFVNVTSGDNPLTGSSNGYTVHPMHIHVNPVQVISVNKEVVNEQFYRDTVILPYAGEIVVRTRFLDFKGEFVAHCHNVAHEDQGMMQNVKVVDNSPDPENVTPDSPDQTEDPPTISTGTSGGASHAHESTG